MDKLQEAIRWVNDHRRAHPEQPMRAVLEDAARRFDLGLPQQNELQRMFRS
jgi:hypothetical protein